MRQAIAGFLAVQIIFAETNLWRIAEALDRSNQIAMFSQQHVAPPT